MRTVDVLARVLLERVIQTANYIEQSKRWPAEGRYILAQADQESVIVYQAYRPGIGNFAATHGYFGGEFSYSRMSWIKPNFLWMMYRSGWGTKAGQEVTLALRLRRAFFDSLLALAVESSYHDDLYPSHQEWQRAVEGSSVRMQWDPDHDPRGTPLRRRALQLGLRGESLEQFGKHQLLEVLDISAFVAEQRAVALPHGLDGLVTPAEHVYLPADRSVSNRLRLDAYDQAS